MVLLRKIIRPRLIGIEIWFGWHLRLGRRQDWHIVVERYANHGAIAGRLLKDRGDSVLAHQLANAGRALCTDISHLHPAFGINGDGARIGRVLRLPPQLNRIAWRADGDLEAAGRALRLIREVDADYR
ncbi:hypothetical protein GGR39_002375 [Novosphingobium fluoreni]|uniref:Uncharacterized protein n=1 Tax=Novosphingobium fluoreni TaxID=1391222 RepID=A0A7W6BZF5_9SPHN|nr:hypothetical protein [Novosphingobium fluoreni]